MISLITALLFFQDTNPVAPPPVNNGSAIVEMLQNSGPIAMAVLGVLLVASLFSWAIIFGKWASFRRAAAQSRRFLRAFRKANRLQEIATVSEQFKPSPLVNVFDEVYETYRRQTGGFGPPKNITALERAGQTAASESLTSMEQRLTWLASIGAISPFIGLFGTIMGIVDAFHGLGTRRHGDAACGCAWRFRSADYDSGGAAGRDSGSGCLQPVHGAGAATLRARMDDFARELLNSMEEAALKPDQDPGDIRGVHK
jgi:biopolymer transport protein TolQ